MGRPQKCRRICGKPEFTSFLPEQKPEGEPITLTLDEFEVIRLVDLEKQTHEQTAKQMEIARSTVTEIYETARGKLADSLVNGRRLFIGGGNYRLCDGSPSWCYRDGCRKQRQRPDGDWKGDSIMRIAVTYENGEIFQHFGHTEQFKYYDVEDGTVVSSKVVDTNGSGHGALAGLLSEGKVDVLVCGGIGGGAQAALSEAGIKLFGGVSGNADEAVAALLSGSLSYNPDVHCDHHDHEHGNGEHHCGDHGCGRHDCH